MRKELLNGLTDEQIKKVENCKNSEEFLAIAKEEGIELNEELLEAVSGGFGSSAVKIKCIHCGSENFPTDKNYGEFIYCSECDNWFKNMWTFQT